MRALELHDTRVLGLRWRETTLVLELDAYVHESAGVPGIDSGTGWSQRVEVAVLNATLEQECPLPLWITDGLLRLGTSELGLVPLPLVSGERVSAEFRGAEGVLRFSGEGLEVSSRGDAVFVEDVPAT